MKSFKILALVAILGLGACSTLEEKAAEEFKESIKGVTYTINLTGVRWFNEQLDPAVEVSANTEYTVADDASFTISGVKFAFAEGEVVNTIATYSLENEGKKYINISVKNNEMRFSFPPAASIAEAGNTYVVVATKK